MATLKDNYVLNKVRDGYYALKNWDRTSDKIKLSGIIKKYHNIHKGEKCVIVGNGPSLRVEDLEKLYTLEIPTFACNRIYKIFPETCWRPTFFFITDELLLEGYKDELDGVPADHRFFPESFRNKLNNGVFFYPGPEYYDYEKESRFSLDASKGVYGGGTVTYEMMQFAYYMGFSEIYLIGVDFSYAVNNPLNSQTYSFEGENNYFIKDYLKPGEVAAIPNINANLLAYHAAREAASENGFSIYNATRGGKLEVFQRVDLDELFRNWSENNH